MTVEVLSVSLFRRQTHYTFLIRFFGRWVKGDEPMRESGEWDM